MKKASKSLLAALAAGTLLASPALAGVREGAFTLTPSIGYHLFEGDQRTDDAVSYGLGFGYNVTKNWGAELELRYAPTDTDNPDQDINVSSAAINALYHFNPDGALVPYLTAGLGGMYFRAEGADDDDLDAVLNAGAGVKYFVSNDLALRLDARYLLDLHSDRPYDQAPDSDDTDHNLIASAGLVWQFGGMPSAPPAPLDSDLDGIPDSRDKCPDTALGVAVDAVGCPPAPPKAAAAPAPVVKPAPVAPPAQPKPVVVPPPVPVDGDDDGDGVKNSLDKCPGTEKGVLVDETGCPLKFTLEIEFDFNKADVRAQYHDQLAKAADFIKKYPGARFVLGGHTDSRGSDEYNQALSERRAAAVKNYLVDKFGIDAAALTARGYGEKQPIADNKLEEGRQKNRRVEVVFSAGAK